MSFLSEANRDRVTVLITNGAPADGQDPTPMRTVYKSDGIVIYPVGVGEEAAENRQYLDVLQTTHVTMLYPQFNSILIGEIFNDLDDECSHGEGKLSSR